VHVAALSVNRWEDYVNTLQPQFSLNATSALALALPRTSISQNNLADIFSAGLQLGLAQSSTTSASTLSNTLGGGTSTQSNVTAGTTNSSGSSTSGGTQTNTAASGSSGSTSTTSTVTSTGNSTTTQTTTTQQGPGTLPASLLPTASLPNAAAQTGPSGTVALDPVLQYQTAAAIYQEVQLLNSYVRDAAQRYGYVPYLARLQLSISPFAHNEPYDVYIDLGVFSRCKASHVGQPVITIPLLVTDNIESGQATNSANIAHQFASSLGGILQNTAFQASLSDLRDQFKAILGNNLNSLYMVTRGGADNVIRVRLGAATAPNPDANYTMLAQTHNVSFLMLVDKDFAAMKDGKCFAQAGANPTGGGNDVATMAEVNKRGTQPSGDASGMAKQGPQIWVNSVMNLRDANTGKELSIDRKIISQRATDVVDRFLPVNAPLKLDDTTTPELETLINDVQTQQSDKFVEDVESMKDKSGKYLLGPTTSPGRIGSLWTGLSSVVPMSEYAGTIFDLPERATLPIDEQETVFLHDNCKDAATVTIGGFGSQSPSAFGATLSLGGEIRLAATSITQAAPGGPFALQFPSLAAFSHLENAPVIAEAVASICPSESSKESKKDGTADPAADMDTGFALKSATLKAKIDLKEIVDNRWGNANDADALGYSFKNIYYDNANVAATDTKSGTSLSLASAFDTIVASPSSGAPNGSATQIRLIVFPGKDVIDFELSFNGAALSGLPALPTYMSQMDGPSLKITPLQGSTTFGGSPVVIDVNLQGMIPGRLVTITASGHGPNKKATQAPPLYLPVVAPGASSAKPSA
jgi:hypothetical protein